MTTHAITPGELDKTLLQRVAAGPLRLAIADSARPGIEASVAAVRTLVSRHEPVYGINTGFGKLAQTRIADDQLVQLQKNLVLSHSAGVGHPLAAPVVRLMLLLKAASLARHEVTNEEYKKFVDAGGYGNRESWKEPFVRDGWEIPWEQGIAGFRDATGRPGPATWEVGAFPKGQEKHPVAGISWYEAAAYAAIGGKSLPTVYQWNLAAQPWLGTLILAGSNFRSDGTRPVGEPGTLSGFGTTDMAGNVKEWCLNESGGGKRYILGGGFGEPEYMFVDKDAQSPWDRKPNFGLRCMKVSSPPPPAAAAKLEPAFRDYAKEKPVSDEVFRAYKGLYAYDKGGPGFAGCF